MSDGLAIGVDIGGTKIAFALVDQQGNTLATHRLPTRPEEGAEAVFKRVAEGVRVLVSQTERPVEGIGVGSPGHLNPHTGIVHNATNLAWKEVPLRQGLQDQLDLDLPVWVQKDGNAAALGEMYFGAAQGYSDFIHIAIGTGLGGGAVVGGELVGGGNFAAMEIGHMPFNPGGRLCACGMRGCPEMYVSGLGLLAAVREHLPAYPDHPLSKIDDVTTEHLLDAAKQNDPMAMAIMTEMSDWLTSVMICLMGILDPSLFVIGGGLGHATYPFLVEGVHKALNRRTVRAVYQDVKMVESVMTSSPVGAACLVWHGLRAESGMAKDK